MLDRPTIPLPDAVTLDQQALATALSGKHLIGGRFVPARSGKTFRHRQPGHRRSRSPEPPRATPPMSTTP